MGRKIHTANEGPVRIQYKCLVSIYVFPEMKTEPVFLNFYGAQELTPSQPM
jgi:hypothetical protein